VSGLESVGAGGGRVLRPPGDVGKELGGLALHLEKAVLWSALLRKAFQQ